VATQTPNFAGFPTGVTAGPITTCSISASSLEPGLHHGAGRTFERRGGVPGRAASGSAYLNIHTNVVPGGEIRGFLTSNVPEPAGLTLLGLGACGAALARLRRRRHPA
jgi:hypothetical protein